MAINANGQIAGFYYDGGYHAFLWSNGTLTELGNLGADYSTAWALSNRGDVAGSSKTASNREHAFLYTGGGMIDLGTLGGKESQALGVNSRREVIGYAYNQAGFALAFLWENGKMISLGTLGGDRSQANAINEAGQIAGYANTAGNERAHAFLWSGGAMHDPTLRVGPLRLRVGLNVHVVSLEPPRLALLLDPRVLRSVLIPGRVPHRLAALLHSECRVRTRRHRESRGRGHVE